MHSLQNVTLCQENKYAYVQEILLALNAIDSLKHLKLSAQKCKPSLLRRFQQLENLSLNVPLSSKDLLASCQSMTYLSTLHLSDEVGSSMLKDIVLYCPLLRELSFHFKPQNNSLNCIRVGKSNIFGALADRAKYLKILSVSGIISDLYDAEQLARISSLNILRCSFSNEDCVLALGQLNLLEELRIVSCCFTNIALKYLELIRACSKLTLLSIMDFRISSDFGSMAATVLEKFVDRQPLTLFIYGHRESTIVANAANINMNVVKYQTMTLHETLKLL
ncbi:uncharacterized protein LOC111597261 isoform X2 [Drosophila hydei]|nr:uncharacterized protein LOC111597261 isoform X2 [Drosophila hydei]